MRRFAFFIFFIFSIVTALEARPGALSLSQELGAKQIDKQAIIYNLGSVPLSDVHGNGLYLAKRLDIYKIYGWGLFIKDQSYILGIEGKSNEFYLLDPLLIRRYQAGDVLAKPLPQYHLSNKDYFKGYSFWFLFGGAFISLLMIKLFFSNFARKRNWIKPKKKLAAPQRREGTIYWSSNDHDIDKIIERVLAKAILANDINGSGQVKLAKQLYERLFHRPLDVARLNNALVWVMQNNGKFGTYLQQWGQVLGFENKLTIMEAVSILLTADGLFGQEQEQELRSVAHYLYLDKAIVNEIVLRIKAVTHKQAASSHQAA